MSNSAIPPRWLNCPRRGQPVAGKFLPLKTMLGSRYDDQVPEENRFHPSMLSNYLKSLKVNMGILVDLTNTSRFYDRTEIEKEGIKYVKLQCKGHAECPTEEVTNMFIRLCEHFIMQHPMELIGMYWGTKSFVLILKSHCDVTFYCFVILQYLKGKIRT
ncbi:mRNA-capping enzyme, partial [Rhincodon typus]|uniref:mRNA-capping enzyme n=1 Tax=Rhincodon typus TaxID=259920 RepID=UPI00202FA6E9